jgi:DNA-binding transcriptional ArsR family regulator
MNFTEEQSILIGEILKSIAHTMRLRIIDFLIDGERTVGEVEKMFGSSTANVSQHLTILRKIGILQRRKQANFMYYDIKDKKILQLIQSFKNLYC